MPSLSNITNNFFINLINRLGVRPPPPESFLLSNIVQPVSLVDSDIVLNATTSTMLLDSPFTAGDQAAPGAGLVLADTLAQVAGNYFVFFDFAANTPAAINLSILFQRRNAANAANIWEKRLGFAVINGGDKQWGAYCELQTNERFRIVNEVAAGAGIVKANIWLQGPV